MCSFLFGFLLLGFARFGFALFVFGHITALFFRLGFFRGGLSRPAAQQEEKRCGNTAKQQNTDQNADDRRSCFFTLHGCIPLRGFGSGIVRQLLCRGCEGFVFFGNGGRFQFL